MQADEGGWSFRLRAGASALAAAAIPAAGGATDTIPSSSPHIGSSQMNQAAHPSTTGVSGATEGAFEVHSRMTDLKVAAAEARTETKFAQLLGEMKLIGEKLGALDTKVGNLDTKIDTVDGHTRSAKGTIVATVIGTGIAIAALAWAGVQIFQGGLGLSAGAFQAGMAAQSEKFDDQSKAGD